MEQIIIEAKREVASRAGQDFANKVKTANGFISAYDNRPVFSIGLPWVGEVKSNLDQVKTTKTGIGIITAVESVSHRCMIIHSEIEKKNGEAEKLLHLAEI